MKYYYMHDTDMRHNRKVVALRRRMGLAGYGAWCMLLEILADADGNVIGWTDTDRELYAIEMDIEPEQLTDLVDTCVRYGMLVVSDDTLYCPGLNERYNGTASDDEPAEAETAPDVVPELSAKRRAAAKKRWSRSMQNYANKDAKPMQNDAKSDFAYAKMQNDANDGFCMHFASSDECKMRDYRENKNKNITNDDVDDSAHVHVRTCEGETPPPAEVVEAEVIDETAAPEIARLEDDVKRIARETIWLDNTARMLHLPASDVRARLPDFVVACIANGKTRHDNAADLKRHFASWLRIQINQTKTNHGTSNNTYRPAASGTKAEANAAVAAACRANVAAYLAGLAKPACDPF